MDRQEFKDRVHLSAANEAGAAYTAILHAAALEELAQRARDQGKKSWVVVYALRGLVSLESIPQDMTTCEAFNLLYGSLDALAGILE